MWMMKEIRKEKKYVEKREKVAGERKELVKEEGMGKVKEEIIQRRRKMGDRRGVERRMDM